MVFKKIFFQNRYVVLETPSRPPRDPLPFMANTILNFHFDYLHPSLTSKGRSPCDIVGGVLVEADHSTEVGLCLLRFGLEKDKECITFWPK